MCGRNPEGLRVNGLAAQGRGIEAIQLDDYVTGAGTECIGEYDRDYVRPALTKPEGLPVGPLHVSSSQHDDSPVGQVMLDQSGVQAGERAGAELALTLEPCLLRSEAHCRNAEHGHGPGDERCGEILLRGGGPVELPDDGRRFVPAEPFGPVGDPLAAAAGGTHDGGNSFPGARVKADPLCGMPHPGGRAQR
jgi:hypothetical protein